MPPLDASTRAHLPDTAFAYVDSTGRRRLPINDVAHVRNALSRFDQTAFESDEAKERARQRLLRAVISATAASGYAHMTIADVVERARVSRKVFYEHFRDKQACFIAACNEGAEIMFARILHAVPALRVRPASASRPLRSLLAAHPLTASDA